MADDEQMFFKCELTLECRLKDVQRPDILTL
jgi:hypothetical protein